MDADDKDFLLALYNKLWENINNKDSRLWTFLSIYAAAVGVVFGVGQAINLGLYAAVVIQVLSLWALFITLNAVWWDQRNRLLVEKVEVKFKSAVKGVIPEIYRAETPRLDWLNQVSVAMIVLIGAVIFLKSIWAFFAPGLITSREILVVLSLQYLVAVLGGYFWLGQQEYFVKQYFDIVDAIHKDTDPNAPYPPSDTIKIARRMNNWRWWALALFLGGTGFFDVAFLNNASQPDKLAWICIIIAILCQLGAAGAFIYHSVRYYWPRDDAELRNYTLDLKNVWVRLMLSLVILALLLLAGVIWVTGSLSMSGTAAPTIAELMAEREKITKLLHDLERKAILLQDQQLREVHKGYLREEDAKRFLPAEERDKFLTNQEAGRRFPSLDAFKDLQKQLQEMRSKNK